jgi:predicted RNA-binding protein with PUA domain
MSYRILDAKVIKVDLAANKLVIKRKKINAGKTVSLRNIFMVDTFTLITTDNNSTIAFSKIKVGSKVTIDFMKTPDKKLLARGISILN